MWNFMRTRDVGVEVRFPDQGGEEHVGEPRIDIVELHTTF